VIQVPRDFADEPSRRLRTDGAPRGRHDDPSPRRAALHRQPTSPTTRAFNSAEAEWFEARVKHWWRKLQQGSTTEALQRHRPSNCASHPLRGQLRAEAAFTSPALRAFRLKTEGKCFKCLSSDHRAASCRDPIRCFRYLGLGHRERDCRRFGTQRSSTAARRACKEDLPPPPSPPRVGQAAMARLGDPETRPDEDECLIPTSFATEASRREWEETAAVSWAMSGPPNTGPREVEAAIRDEFRLRQGEVVVTRHHPQAFLIKFHHRHHCSRALQQGFAKRHGIDIHFVKWRSLANCLGVSLLFRVKLCLDGVPRHAWDDGIVERIIGRRCALESIDTDLLHPAETKTIDLWAWTANPSLIPKKIWLTFTNRAKDAKLQSILVTETSPEHWEQGTRHAVIIHLEEIHDYTASTIDDKGNISPGKRRLPKWHLGVVDGAQVPARAFEEFPHHPPPPRRTDKEEPRTRRPDSRSSKGTKGRYNNDHPDFYKGRGKRHDDDDDYDTYGRGGRDDPGRYGRGDHSGAGGYRERDRSPPRRLWAHGSRHGGRQRAPDALEHAVVQPTELLLPAKLPQVSVLQVTEEAELQRLFKAHAMALQGAMQRIMDRAGVQHTGEMASLLKSLMQDYIDKASALAEGLGLLQGPPEAARLDLHEAGNEARSKRPPSQLRQAELFTPRSQCMTSSTASSTLSHRMQQCKQWKTTPLLWSRKHWPTSSSLQWRAPQFRVTMV